MQTTLMSVYNKRDKVKWSYGGMLPWESFLFLLQFILVRWGQTNPSEYKWI